MKSAYAAFALVAALALPQPADAAEPRAHDVQRPTLASLPIVSRDFTVVDDRYIRISDLFENAGENADITVAYAPHPGKRAVFDARWLFRVAQAYKLNWRPRGRQVQVVVTRQSSVIEPSEIRTAIKTELINRGFDSNTRVQLASAGSRLHVSGTMPSHVYVDDLNHDSRNHRFTAILAAETSSGSIEKFRVTGQVFAMIDMPVLARSLRGSDIIRADDIEWMAYRADRVDDRFVRDVETLVGMSPRRLMKARTPVRAKDLREPLLVTKRSTVIIRLHTPVLAITAQGRALESGALGQVVRVVNSQSRKTIEAVVTGPNTVTVGRLGSSVADPRLALK